jgi:hypothetical protein
MERLVQVADEVDEILQGFLPFLRVGFVIGQHPTKAFRTANIDLRTQVRPG